MCTNLKLSGPNFILFFPLYSPRDQCIPEVCLNPVDFLLPLISRKRNCLEAHVQPSLSHMDSCDYFSFDRPSCVPRGDYALRLPPHRFFTSSWSAAVCCQGIKGALYPCHQHFFIFLASCQRIRTNKNERIFLKWRCNTNARSSHRSSMPITFQSALISSTPGWLSSQIDQLLMALDLSQYSWNPCCEVFQFPFEVLSILSFTGPYVKHSNNYGFVSPENRSTPQAFKHLQLLLGF